MKTFREIAEIHYGSEPDNEFDKQYRLNRINALENMIVLKYTKTHENCPKGCKEISYLHDDQEHKTCIKCRCEWNRITNEVVR